ncbi:hypothetical protein OG875_04705 [Streptomyces sp. NBC_01498]|uniref:hypothetical protein n=1 Tax=Streptomyces sp. NBC_01498 TaxID=2975870 RepID=UPI002E7BC7FE|nr:hypothetical protein [Streptomyces sp. NBC_01498]WTL23956.1 hypothetical protein OG875_04705 [Streptomyces sp. NBC_01498]
MAGTSRKTTPRKATTQPVRTPRELASAVREPQSVDYEDEDEVDAAEAQQIEAEGHFVTAMLADEEIRIVPPGAWRQSWQTALSNAQFTFFAEQVVHPDDLDLYFEIDPTNDEFEAFVAEAARRGGESLGKSRGPATSSRRTRRR